MIYDNPFIEIENQEFPLIDLSRNQNKGIISGRNIDGNYYKTINRLEVAYIPELTTAWLSQDKSNDLKEHLYKTIIDVKGLVIAPYFYDLNLSPLKAHPILAGEEVIGKELYQITFELESVSR